MEDSIHAKLKRDETMWVNYLSKQSEPRVIRSKYLYSYQMIAWIFLNCYKLNHEIITCHNSPGSLLASKLPIHILSTTPIKLNLLQVRQTDRQWSDHTVFCILRRENPSRLLKQYTGCH